MIHLQVHTKELLSGSFGPLQGPITTLTSLAAFKARFQQPGAPSALPGTRSAAQQAAPSASFGAPPPPQQRSRDLSSLHASVQREQSLAGVLAEQSGSLEPGQKAKQSPSAGDKATSASVSAPSAKHEHSTAGHDRQHGGLSSASNGSMGGHHMVPNDASVRPIRAAEGLTGSKASGADGKHGVSTPPAAQQHHQVGPSLQERCTQIRLVALLLGLDSAHATHMVPLPA